MSVARSAHCRMFAGGTDRRRRCPGRVSGGRTLAEAGAQTDCGHVRQGTGEVLKVPTRRSRVGARVDERLRRGSLLPPPIGSTDSVEAGGSPGIGKRLPSVDAGWPGVCSVACSPPAGLIGSRRAIGLIARHLWPRPSGSSRSTTPSWIVDLPDIGRSPGFSGGTLQLVISAYARTFGGFLLLGGRAADLLGRRRMFMAALGLFGVASLAGGLLTGLFGWPAVFFVLAAGGAGAHRDERAARPATAAGLRRGRARREHETSGGQHG